MVDTTEDVLRISVSKDRLRQMPADERALFILLGYAANQLSVFTKLVIFSSNKDGAGVEQTLSAAQTQMLLRVVIGFLNEAWMLVQNRFLMQPLGKTYIPLLDAGGQAALTKLKKAFGQRG